VESKAKKLMHLPFAELKELAKLFGLCRQWCSQPKNSGGAKKIGGGGKCVILGEYHYFVWKTTCQSTK